MKGAAASPRAPDGQLTVAGSERGCRGKQIFFCQAAAVVKYIRPAALILHPVTLMIQSTQYKY